MMVLKRETLLGLTVGQILSILILLGGLLTSYAALMSRITAVEVNILNVQNDLEAYKLKQDAEINENQKEMKVDINRLNDKLDELKTLLINKK